MHLVLVMALIMAGLPAHAGSHAAAISQAGTDTRVVTPDGPDGSDCPFHGDSKSQPDAASDPSPDEPSRENCCGSDCRCSCAGLTLMLIPSLTPLVVISPEIRSVRLTLSRPSHRASAPLRPPQV